MITGPTRGLGRELFLLAHQHGFPVIAIGRDLGRIVDISSPQSSKIALIDFDLSKVVFADDERRLRTLLTAALDDLLPDRLVFISNAGVIEPIGQVGSFSHGSLTMATALNIVAPMLISNAMLSWMSSHKCSAMIINLTSGAANRPIAGWAAYCSTKSGAKMFFDVLSLESRISLEVHHFDPGVLDTKMQETIREVDAQSFPRVEEFKSFHRQGTLKSPAAVAGQIMQKIFHWVSS